MKKKIGLILGTIVGALVLASISTYTIVMKQRINNYNNQKNQESEFPKSKEITLSETINESNLLGTQLKLDFLNKVKSLKLIKNNPDGTKEQLSTRDLEESYNKLWSEINHLFLSKNSLIAKLNNEQKLTSSLKNQIINADQVEIDQLTQECSK
ncbi:hypothetical protein [Mycoplasmopsis sturni]|uniref:hypothetical protein n=1 Tax=Mycoplasmopsis sturni TaxID=39047 RepID=UPI000566272C|nr:hypothetical protein [Mycoplasmopsis sturni]